MSAGKVTHGWSRMLEVMLETRRHESQSITPLLTSHLQCDIYIGPEQLTFGIDSMGHFRPIMPRTDGLPLDT